MSLKALISSDWFVNAIVKDGSVRQCLAEVMGELSRKKKFIELLSEKLGEDSSTGGDALSKLSARIRMLENTESTPLPTCLRSKFSSGNFAP